MGPIHQWEAIYAGAVQSHSVCLVLLWLCFSEITVMFMKTGLMRSKGRIHEKVMVTRQEVQRKE